MLARLDDAPDDNPIDVETRGCLEEPGFAPALAGVDAKPYTTALHDLMSREVESRSMLGLLGNSPHRMCGALRAIDGNEAADNDEYCMDPDDPPAQRQSCESRGEGPFRPQ